MAKNLFTLILNNLYMVHHYRSGASRLYSPNLKDVAGLEDAHLNFNSLCNCPIIFLIRELGLSSQIYKQMYGKVETLIEHRLVKLHPLNLMKTIFYQAIERCESQIAYFRKSHLPSLSIQTL